MSARGLGSATAVVAVIGLLAAFALARAAPGAAQPVPAAATLPASRATGATRVDSSPEQWLRSGFVELVTPLRPPTSLDGNVRIVVFVKVPASEAIRVAHEGTRDLPLFPVGTEAARVEYLAAGSEDSAPAASWRVLDVRSTRLTADGEHFSMARPSPRGDALLELGWSRSEGAPSSVVTDDIRNLVLDGAVDGPRDEAGRRQLADRLASLADCSSCHQHRRPERPRGLVRRGTDASGFHVARSVLSDRELFETYRPRNANVGDGHVRWLCAGEERREQRCRDGEIAEGVYDVRSARAEGSAHAERVCASRRWLATHFDEDARRTFAEALDECGAAEDGRPP